jgi:hypothetical protein
VEVLQEEERGVLDVALGWAAWCGGLVGGVERAKVSFWDQRKRVS